MTRPPTEAQCKGRVGVRASLYVGETVLRPRDRCRAQRTWSALADDRAAEI